MDLMEEIEKDNFPARRKGKDSIFLNLFHIPKYTLELVKTLHPELNVVETDVERVSLQSVLVTKPYNDLGIIVKDKLLILVEAQSTWSVNILIRILLYWAMTYHEYLKKTPQWNLYGSGKIFLPKPEFYVIYTGKIKNCPKELSLAEEFFDGDATADLRVKILTEAGKENIIQQYIEFCHVFDRQTKKHGYTLQAVLETIKICRDENILRDYLEKQAQEVQTIMMTLFSQEEVMKRHDISLVNNNTVKHIKNLMESLNWTEEQAMDALKVPQEDRKWLLYLMSQPPQPDDEEE